MTIAGKRLLVVTDSEKRFVSTPYQLRSVVDAWTGEGGEALLCDDPDALPDADVTIAHIDATVVPARFQAAFARRGGVLNGAVADISKRRVSRHLVCSPAEWAGPVIVKTNRNHGGWPELDALRGRGMHGRAVARLARALPWSVTGLLGVDHYPVFERSRDVPWFVWRHPKLVVERLHAEVHDGLYALRQHIFFGERQLDTILFGTAPVVKAANVVRREPLGGAPEEVLRLRRALGFDFGKFDYTISGGEAVVFDVNPTPSFADNDRERWRNTAACLFPALREIAAGRTTAGSPASTAA